MSRVEFHSHQVLLNKYNRLREAVLLTLRIQINENSRWPCPFCGRRNSESELVSVEILHKDADNKTYIEGCWYCATVEPKLQLMRKALKENRGEE